MAINTTHTGASPCWRQPQAKTVPGHPASEPIRAIECQARGEGDGLRFQGYPYNRPVISFIPHVLDRMFLTLLTPEHGPATTTL
jgi:hypothetical protein